MQVKGFKVQIRKEVWDKIFMYAQCCPQEISGFGKTEAIQNGVKVNEVFLIDQEVGPATTNMAPKAVYEAVMACAQKGQDSSDWGLWWHSHVNMNTFFSGVDQETIEQLSGEAPLVSICVNKAGKYACRVDFYQPYRLMMENVEVEVISNKDLTLEEICKTDIHEHVKVTASIGFMGLSANKPAAGYVRPFYGANGCVITPGDLDKSTYYRPLPDFDLTACHPSNVEDEEEDESGEGGYLVDATFSANKCRVCGSTLTAQEKGYCKSCKCFDIGSH